jgi:hypothetical protein
MQIPNPAALAFAANMKIDPKDRLNITRDFYISLALTDISPEDKVLVAGYFSAYQPLTTKEALQLERKLTKVKPDVVREAVMNLTNPFIELGKREGRQEGRQEGQAELILKLIARLLGKPSPAHEKAIRKLSVEKIEALGEALLDFTAPADLTRWLRKNK